MPDRTALRARVRIAAVLAVVPLAFSGCYHYRLTVPASAPATEYERATFHSFAWGFLEKGRRAHDCQSNALDEVRVTTNAAYLAAAVLTLGIWVPLDVEWRCAKPCQRTGVI